MEVEIWLPVVGYEGLYEVSNIGRVKSLAKWDFGDRKRFRPEKIMKVHLDNHGYLSNSLRKNGKTVIRKNHNILTKAHLPNPENKPYINHINGIKFDNRLENLEWCTASENQIHAWANGLNRLTEEGRKRVSSIRKLRVGIKHQGSKKILNTKTLEIFISIKEAAEKIGMKHKTLSNILIQERNRNSRNETNLIFLNDFKFIKNGNNN